MSEGVTFVQCMEFDCLQGLLVPSELAEIIPTHGIHIREANLVTESRVVLIQESISIFNPKNLLLLDDLGVDMGRPYPLDLSNEVVTYPLNRLAGSQLRECHNRQRRVIIPSI